MPIQYPNRNEGRTALRRIVEAVAQELPLTGALAHLYGYTHPSEFEQAIEQFQRDLATAANDHEVRLARLESMLASQAVVSPLGIEICFHLLRSNNSGREDSVAFTAVIEAFPDSEVPVVEEAIAELESIGYLSKTATIGRPIHSVRPKNSMFLALDLMATGRDTRADALAIARLWLDDEQARNIYHLHEHLGWEPRRLNPPIAALRQVFAEGRWSGEIHPVFEATGVLVTSDERFKLRRILESQRVG